MNISGKTINELTYECSKALIEQGNEFESRDGNTKELMDVQIRLTNPKERHLHIKGRGNNIYSSLAEVFWVLGGQENVDPYLSFFLKRAAQFADPSKTFWTDAYGSRLMKLHQMEGVVERFLDEGKNTRRAIMSIYDPNLDTPRLQEINRGLPRNAALPCNDTIVYWIRENKIHSNLFSRSADLIWGTCLTGDTKISLLDGTDIPIKDLVGRDEFKVYSYDISTQSTVSGRGHSARKMGTKKVYKIILSNKEIIRATDNHPFLLTDNNYVEVKDLKVGDSIKSLYIRLSKNNHKIISIEEDGYEDVYDISVDKYHNFALTAGVFVHNSNINILEFSIMQELVLRLLQNEDKKFNLVDLGSYRQNIISMHVYDQTLSQAENIYKMPMTCKAIQGIQTDDIDLGILKIGAFGKFFWDLFQTLQLTIVSDDKQEYGVEEVFKSYGVPLTDNQLYNYAKLVEQYIISKKGYSQDTWDLSFLHGLKGSLLSSIIENKFTPKSFIKELLEN